MNDIRHSTIESSTTLSPNSSTSSTASASTGSSTSTKLMNNSINLFSSLLQNQATQPQQVQQTNSIYESYIKAAAMLQQQQQQGYNNGISSSLACPVPQQQQQQQQQQQKMNSQQGSINNNNAYDLTYRSLLQYNPVAAAAAACAAFYNAKELQSSSIQPKLTKNDNSYETVSPSLSDEEDEDEHADENNNNNNNNSNEQQTQQQQIKIEDERLEEGEIARNSDEMDCSIKKKRRTSVSSLSSESDTSKPNNGVQAKDTFDKIQKCLINDTDNAIIQCFNQEKTEEEDDEFIKQKENIPSTKPSVEVECKKLSNNYKIDSLLDSNNKSSTTTVAFENGGNKKLDLINRLKSEILIAVNNAIQKTFENFIRSNCNNSKEEYMMEDREKQNNFENDSKRILKRNLISSNMKPFKRQRLNDNPSSRSLYKNHKYLSASRIGYEPTAFKPLTHSTNNSNKFSINQLTSVSNNHNKTPLSSASSTSSTSAAATAVAVNQLYAAAISHLQNQPPNNNSNGHHHLHNHHNSTHQMLHHTHPQQQQQQQLFFAAAAAASNPYLNATNTNRLFTPYLMDNINSTQTHQNPLIGLAQSQQQLNTNGSNAHIFHTPIKRRRTKVTDTRLSPRASSLNLNQLSKPAASNLLIQNCAIHSPSSAHDDNETYVDDVDDLGNESNGDDQHQSSQIYDNLNDDEEKHSTNDGLMNIYSNDNEDLINNNQPTSDYTGYQISFLQKKKKEIFFYLRE